MPALHLIGGDKGGTGKSFVCRALIQYHLDRGIACSVFDSDRSNPDVMRIYGKDTGCRVAVFSEGERYEDTANALFNAALEQRTICNLPAQIFIAVRQWLENNELLDLAAEAGVTFYQWHISDCGSDSLKLFINSLNYFGDRVPHIFVKNFGMTDDWEPFDDDEQLQKLVADYGVRVIGFPKYVGNRDRNMIDSLSMTFGQAREYEGFGPIQRQRVKTFLRKAYESFDEVRYLDDASAAN